MNVYIYIHILYQLCRHSFGVYVIIKDSCVKRILSVVVVVVVVVLKKRA